MSFFCSDTERSLIHDFFLKKKVFNKINRICKSFRCHTHIAPLYFVQCHDYKMTTFKQSNTDFLSNCVPSLFTKFSRGAMLYLSYELLSESRLCQTVIDCSCRSQKYVLCLGLVEPYTIGSDQRRQTQNIQ